MSSTSSCPRCGRPSPSANTFCAGCGARLSSGSNGRGWKLFLGAFAVFAGLVWAAALFTRPGPATQVAGVSQPQALTGSNSTAAQAAQPAPSPSLTLTSAQHLAEAKRALADGYRPDNDPRKAKWGEVSAAGWHLRSIGSAAPEYQEARQLLKEVARRERQVELARKQAGRDEDSDKTDASDASDEDSDDDADDGSSAAASSTPHSSPPAPAAARQSPTAGTTGGASSSDYYTNSRGARVQRPTRSESGPPAGATAQCRDGSYSFSQSRRGTCSHHGGVSRWL